MSRVGRRSRRGRGRAVFAQVIKDYLRTFTNESLRAAVKEYFEDKAAAERRHGKIGTWDVSRVTDMSRLFYKRQYFKDPGIAAWDTSSVTTMNSMFCGCTALTADLGAWDTLSAVRKIRPLSLTRV